MNRIYFALILITQPLLSDVDYLSHVKYGLAPLLEHEQDHLENHVHKIIEVTPNHVGMGRIKTHLESQKIFADIPVQKKEFGTLKASSQRALQKLSDSAHLPTRVDNSKLACFPPIGDQGILGSCVAWGSTYYQASHELGLIHGWNNKTSSKHILSPKWTYNLINQGINAGSSPVFAYQVLETNGAPSIEEFPYDNDFTAWDLNSEHWISALYNRMAPCTLIPGLGGSGPQNLTAIKQALNNGHILTFATFIDSWIYTQIKPDPENPSSLHVGEYAAFWMNGDKGGHFLTIVGYDDELWIDVNQNGVVDPGERGAFLIANSWGPQWGNNGFIWISYDAFLKSSAVPGAPQIDRIPAGEYFNSCVIAASPKAANYMPRLIAEFTISQVERNQISIQTGISSPHEINPTTLISIPAFANKGGAFEFDGTHSNAPQTATFAIDLTDFLPDSNYLSSQRYYLLVGDNVKGNPTTLNSFSLLDLVRQKKISSLLSLPQSYDNETGSIYIDY